MRAEWATEVNHDSCALRIIAFLLMLVSCETYAIFGRTVYVTPETEIGYGIKVQFTDIEERKNTYRVQLRAVGYDDKYAWLTVATEKIAKVERTLLFGMGVLPITDKILIRVKLHPINRDNDLYYEIEISSEHVRNGYIYIGFQQIDGVHIYDGGYRYLIDLGAYADRHQRLKVEEVAPLVW